MDQVEDDFLLQRMIFFFILHLGKKKCNKINQNSWKPVSDKCKYRSLHHLHHCHHPKWRWFLNMNVQCIWLKRRFVNSQSCSGWSKSSGNLGAFFCFFLLYDCQTAWQRYLIISVQQPSRPTSHIWGSLESNRDGMIWEIPWQTSQSYLCPIFHKAFI